LTSDETIYDLGQRLKSQGYITPNQNFKLFNEVDGVIWDVTQLDLNEKLIIDCLSQSDDWLTRDAIQGHTNLSKATCNRLLSGLTNTEKIERAKVGKGYQYKITHRLTDSPTHDIYKSDELIGEPIAETIDNSELETLRLNDSENRESVGESVIPESENIVNVQNEVIENSLPSEIIDTVDTEKESKPDSMTFDGITFKIGDYVYRGDSKHHIVKITSFRSDNCGDWGLGPVYEVDKLTDSLRCVFKAEDNEAELNKNT
jgi:predicted transcriptional regulator